MPPGFTRTSTDDASERATNARAKSFEDLRAVHRRQPGHRSRSAWGDLPDAIVDGKVKLRGQRAAGILLYDGKGQQRSGYVTFEPSGNVGLTLDTRKGQVASFIAGPESTGAMQLFTGDATVELRADEGGPSLHAVRRKQVVFREPPVENPQSTALCKALREAKKQPSTEQLLDARRARTSEAACQACLAK